MSTVFLHIGTAKTGTTALQRFLLNNRAHLNEYGFDHPVMPFHYPRMSDARNAHFLSQWAERRDDTRWDRGFEVIKESCGHYENVTMSDEVLWAQCIHSGFLESVRSGFDKIGAGLKIIVYLRRQDEMVESHWNQMVKGKLKLTEDFDSFVGGGGYDKLFPLDYKRVLDDISDCFGRENVFVRPYEKEQFKDNSIFADFLEIIGLKLDEGYELSEYAVNTRLPWNVVEIKRIINAIDSYRDPDTPNFFREIIRDVYGLELSREIPDIRTGRFTAEKRKEFIDKFEEGNAYIAREYLGRADGRLFINELKNLPQWEVDPVQMRNDIIRVLSGAAVYEYRKRRELETRVNTLSDKISKLSDRIDRLSKRESDTSEKVKELSGSFLFRMPGRHRTEKEES